VIYFDENNKEVYNEDFHTFNDMLVEGQPLTRRRTLSGLKYG